MSKLLVLLIIIYQRTISPDHGLFRARHPYGFCRFYPSCSEYTKQSIVKHGVLKGIYYGVVRIIKCNPFSEPAIDKVPNNKLQISNKFQIQNTKFETSSSLDI